MFSAIDMFRFSKIDSVCDEASVLADGCVVIGGGGHAKVSGHADVYADGWAEVGSGGSANVFNGGYADVLAGGVAAVFAGGRASAWKGGVAHVRRGGRISVRAESTVDVREGGRADIWKDVGVVRLHAGAHGEIYARDGVRAHLLQGCRVIGPCAIGLAATEMRPIHYTSSCCAQEVTGGTKAIIKDCHALILSGGRADVTQDGVGHVWHGGYADVYRGGKADVQHGGVACVWSPDVRIYARVGGVAIIQARGGVIAHLLHGAEIVGPCNIGIRAAFST